MSERIKIDGPGVYHITSRVVQKRRLLGEVQREVWVRALWKAARFSGVEVIAYCVLQTHFHILVRVDPAAKRCGDAELVERYRALYGGARAAWSGLTAGELARALANDPPEAAERLRERLRARMGDISAFMRTLRQRYTMWFNKTYETAGTLWAERFGSTLVEDVPWLVGLVAAYIDLNAVRAGLADLPEDYRWCGYAEALAGGRAELRASLAACYAGAGGEAGALGRYRMLLLGKGAAAGRGGKGARIDAAALAEAARNGGELSAEELARVKARFFTRGRVLGTRRWMEEGEGAAVLRGMKRPPVPVPVECAGDLDLAVANRRAAFGVEAADDG